MKTAKTILNMAIAGMLVTTAGIAVAQSDTVRLEGTTAIVPNAGNALERELTPALREQARKTAILENKKLDLEIEKVDLDIVKTQQESLTISNPIAASFGANSMGGMMGRPTQPPKVIDATSMSNSPIAMPVFDKSPAMQTEPKKANLSGEALDNSDKSIRVLMIAGNEGDLKAKIMHNRQGGYVVGKGDTLPNGKKVVGVTSQFIEVVPPKGKTKSKIYVSGYPSEAEEKAFANGLGQPSMTTDSASVLPPSMPSAGGMANAIPSPFGVPIAGIPSVVTSSPIPLTPGQVR